MDQLGITRSRVKPALAWAAEKLGRLKLNGQLRGYSPLSRLVELEGLYLGLTGQIQMWRVLEQVCGGRLDEFDFGELAERAEGQRSKVHDLHRAAAARALTSGDSHDD